MNKKTRWSLRISLALCAALVLASAAWVVTSMAATPTVTVAQGTKLGDVLTDAQGRTPYIFKKDKPGESVCVDTCAKNWPPLTVSEGMQPVAGPGITGKLGQIERKDDTYQVTYNGMPLYYFIKDTKPGDMNGQNVGGVWFVVPAKGSAMAASGQPAKSW